MQIYVIDDKGIEIEKACEAIKVNGHEVTAMERSIISGMVEFFNRPENIDNTNRAWSATREVFAAVAKMKAEGGGIITDMMFHLATASPDDPIPPSGLLVVLQAIAAGVPVVVCTDAAEVGGHHAKALHWIFDGYICPAQIANIPVPFGWIENKDWDAAVKLLEQLHASKNES
jgi:hypothetical protein